MFWGGGSVALAVPGDNFHTLKCEPAERLEDGTVAFLDILALRHGFEMLQRLGGMPAVQAHAACLSQWLFTRMAAMKHANGAPLFLIFGRHGLPDAAATQGAIINFEVCAFGRLGGDLLCEFLLGKVNWLSGTVKLVG